MRLIFSTAKFIPRVRLGFCSKVLGELPIASDWREFLTFLSAMGDSKYHVSVDALTAALRDVYCCASGLRTAAELIERAKVQSTLRERAARWDRLSEALGIALGAKGHEVQNLAQAKASLTRAIIKIKVGVNDLRAVMEECKWCEAVAAKRCAAALRSDIPAEIKSKLAGFLHDFRQSGRDKGPRSRHSPQPLPQGVSS